MDIYAKLVFNINDILTKQLPSFIRDELQSMLGIIRIKSQEHKHFLRSFSDSSRLMNETRDFGFREKRQLGMAAILSKLIFSGLEEVQIVKLNKVVAELQKQGLSSFKKIGVLSRLTDLNTHKIMALEASQLKVAHLMNKLVIDINNVEIQYWRKFSRCNFKD